MHDPMTVAFTIRYPWVASRTTLKSGKVHVYREPIVTIWHVDPETDGSDDSCDWGGRRRQLDDRERELFEALDDLFHELGNEPYYPDERLYGTDPHGRDPTGWGPVGRAQRAMNHWRARSGFRIHPRWHVWHWRIQVHPWQKLKRWLFERCAHCGERYPWGYYPTGYSWGGGGPTVHRECARDYEASAAVDRVIRESQRHVARGGGP